MQTVSPMLGTPADVTVATVLKKRGGLVPDLRPTAEISRAPLVLAVALDLFTAVGCGWVLFCGSSSNRP